MFVICSHSSDSKSLQQSRTLQSILAYLNDTVVWMVSIFHQFSSFYSLFTKPFGTVPSAPTIIGITVTRIFHCFFSSLARYLFIFLLMVFHCSLLQSPGLFSVFWPISTILPFGWSPLVLLPPSPSVPLPIFRWLYRVCQLQSICLSFCILLFSFCGLPEQQNALKSKFFFLVNCSSGLLIGIKWSVVC